MPSTNFLPPCRVELRSPPSVPATSTSYLSIIRGCTLNPFNLDERDWFLPSLMERFAGNV
uniref:Uncharacterized protein n=1 Tax=Kalanchoe fedtschenkoi TaxID=63787 RepID=A0A7N0SWD2_KALFE